jgi:hypothetical protein
MNPLSPRRQPSSRQRPAINPYQWLDAARLSPDEQQAMREHVLRCLLADEEGNR